MTINRALRELTDEGWLVRLQGVGTFVAEPKGQSALFEVRSIAEEIAARRHQHRCEVLTLERVRANAIQASALNVNESDVIFHSIMVHYENDLPVQIEDRCVNADIAVDYLTQDYRQTTPHAYLSRIAPLTEGEHIVEAVRATAQECAWLTIKEHELVCSFVVQPGPRRGLFLTPAYFSPGRAIGYRDDLSPERAAAGKRDC